MLERLTLSQRIDSSADEEVVAELSSMLLCLLLGLNTWTESIKYICDYLINDESFIAHRGRLEYMRKCTKTLLKYVLRIK
jgi:antirestriction protein ArdC